LIIATDKKRIPQPITKIAASFNCKIFNPDHDLTVEEKDDIVRIPIKDVHEKDALAAATFAYKYFAPQFNNIDRNLEALGLSHYRDQVKEMIINKEAKNIAEAIEKIKPKEEKIEKVPTVTKEVYLNWRERAKELEKKFKDEERRYDILRSYSEKIEDKSKELEKQKQEYIEEQMKKNEDTRKKVIKEKEIKTRDILIKQLQFELAKQKNFNSVYEEQLKIQEELENIQNENLMPVIIIQEFTKESVLNANKRFNIRNKIIWIKNFRFSKSSANVVISLKPKVLIGNIDEETKDMLKKAGIITVDTLIPEERKYYAGISSEKIENEIKKVERKNFTDWLEDYRKR
jgi:predicted RNase H-like nuclease (RuvC/YqgF family)